MIHVGFGHQTFRQKSQTLRQERKWRQFEQSANGAPEDISISRWIDPDNTYRREEATTPDDKFFIGICLKRTKLRLTRENHRVFDGVMAVGTVYVGAPLRQLTAQFDTPFDFLHLHVSTSYFPVDVLATQLYPVRDLNDLIVVRDTLVEQLAKALLKSAESADQQFVQCIGQTLARHVCRLDGVRSSVHALSKWRLGRVAEYVKINFQRTITLADLARAAGLSRMHFAAQFRAATGVRPHEYVLLQRVERAKCYLSDTNAPLADVALAVGFCTQSHFSTVFKRITGKTPARWRHVRQRELPSIGDAPRGSRLRRQILEPDRRRVT